VRLSSLSPWPYFIAALVVCWALLIRNHLAEHGSGHAADPSAVWAMWTLMTMAMMAPTAVPVLASLRDVLTSSSIRPWWAFLGGYLVIWLGFAGAAASGQLWVIDLDLVGHDGSVTSPALTASLLAVAGVYQFSSLKRRCGTECVHPMTFFFQHWRDGVRGGARMGLRHGVACLGCCWALMLLAFVGGVANIWFMILSAVVMSVEKLPAVGRFVTAPLGVALLIGSVVVFAGRSNDVGRASHHQHSIESPNEQTPAEPVDAMKGNP
jgi:predicted metal-binding membrane protein